ncbi:hypothetical protein B0H11DRAFT_871593 [Mycena galericulata]|nr:hypothetical protein B0H11DRAFT_871593 [Mycena galericulata]
MPFFRSNTGVQINGGTFYDVAGDINVHNMLEEGDERDLSLTLESETGGMEGFTSDPRTRERHRQPTDRNDTALAYDAPRSQNRPSRSLPLRIPSALRSLFSSKSGRFSSLNVPPPLPPPSPPSLPSALRSIFSQGISRDSHPSPQPLTAAHSLFSPRQESRLDPLDGLSSSWEFPTTRGNVPSGLDSDGMIYPSTSPGYPVELGQTAFHSHSPFPPPVTWAGHFPEPQTTINGGTFISGNVTQIQQEGEQGLHILYRAAANDAFHDSAERFPQPRCHPETRTKMLSVLESWARGFGPERHWNIERSHYHWDLPPPENEKSVGRYDPFPQFLSIGEDHRDNRILWLNGPAGAGKSAVAQSLCLQLEAKGGLGASFFFKRGNASRGNGNKLFPTIAYQLALHLPQLRGAIAQVVKKDPSIVDRSLSIQVERLIIGPCQMHLSGCRQPVTVIIDGLDECTGPEVQQEILRSIGKSLRDRSLNLRYLIASRPEAHIQEIFADSLSKFHIGFPIDQSFEDVRKFLQVEFSRIHRDHGRTMAEVPLPWPTNEIIDQLIEKSSGHFIYASTVIKFIDDRNFRPNERLSRIMGTYQPHGSAPFSAIDNLYIQILSEAVVDRPRVFELLAVIAAEIELPIHTIEQLLEWQSNDISLALRGLRSLLGQESHGKTGPTWIKVYHASFIDFLQDEKRSKTFFVNDLQHRKNLTCRILRAFSNVDGPESTRRALELRNYGRNFWKFLATVDPSPDLVELVSTFMPDYLFGWRSDHEVIDVVLQWLKKNAEVVPDTLIQRWEDYSFMLDCQRWWSEHDPQAGPFTATSDPENLTETISLVTPQLVKILGGFRITIFFDEDHHHTHSMMFSVVQQLWGLPWNEARNAICSLRTSTTPDTPDAHSPEQRPGGGELAKGVYTILPYYFRKQFAETKREFACKLMHTVKETSILEDHLRSQRHSFHKEYLSWPNKHWHVFLRWCPPYPELLPVLRDLEPSLNEESYSSHPYQWYIKQKYSSNPQQWHNTLQWLKVHVFGDFVSY